MDEKAIYGIILSVLTHEATEEEQLFLKQWLNESLENKEEYTQIVQLYQLYSPKREEQSFDVEVAWRKVHSKTSIKRNSFTFRVFLRYAALLVFVISIGLIYFFKPDKEVLTVQAVVDVESIKQPTLLLENGEQIILSDASFIKQENDFSIRNEANDKLIYESKESGEIKKVTNNQLIIPHGSTYQIVLSDGTHVWLNSESQFSYPSEFTGDKRIVTLHGEAFFKVTPNKDQPFIVKANGVDVEVLGTSFNVSCYNSESAISATLVEGSVSVSTENGDGGILSPSEQLTYDKVTRATRIQEVNTDIYTAWTRGEYIFKDVPLATIIEKLQRWHEFTFEYEDDSLMKKRYTFNAGREIALDKLLEVISYTSDVKLERINNSIHIKRKGDKSL